jgi:hypothetical protein
MPILSYINIKENPYKRGVKNSELPQSNAGLLYKETSMTTEVQGDPPN